MKISFIISIVLAFNMSFSLAQNWAPIGATWYYTWNNTWGPPTPQSSKYEVVDDTVILGKTCSRIEKLLLFDDQRPDHEFLYEENDTVFFYDTVFSEFQVLYDINAIAGQFWYIRLKNDFPSIGDIDTVVVTVDSTDLVLINTYWLKRLHITYSYLVESAVPTAHSSAIVEYLGDTTLLFNFTNSDGVFDLTSYSSGLRCYSDSFLGDYESIGILGHCSFVSSIEIFESSEDQSLFHPNPASNGIYLSSSVREYSLVSISGEQILRGVKVDGSEFIDLALINRGVYILHLIEDNKQNCSYRIVIE